jgi:hypothetical protein
MNKRFFVDEAITDEGKYRVLQEDLVTKERFGVKDFDTKEEAQRTADDMQRATDKAVSEIVTGELPSLPLSVDDSSNETVGNKYKDTPQDLKDETSQE